MKGLMEALPQITLLVVLVINVLSSVFNRDRSTKASLVAAIIILGLTYWGGFFEPLIDFFNAKR